MIGLGLGVDRGFDGGANGAASLLLDDYSGAAAAYSVRKLSGTYTGSAMRIRRDNDDAELDIGFDGDGNLDTAAIATHCDVNNGYVSKWYDQSGNSNDAAQAGFGSQPQIYNGAAVVTENGKPAVKFNDDDLVMVTAVSAVTMSIVVKVDANTTSSNSYLWSDTPYNAGSGFHGGGASPSRTGYGVQIITPTIEGFQGTTEDFDQHLVTYHDGATDTLFQDGSSYATGSLSNTPSVQRLGSRGSYQLALDGKIQELVLWDTSTQQSNRTAIETDLNNYFSIYT